MNAFTVVTPLLLLLLASGGPVLSAEMANLEKAAGMPFLWGLHDQGRVPWGRWFTEMEPRPCGSGEPGSCDEMRVAISPEYGDEDNAHHPVFLTERAQRWTILGYTGHLEYLEGGQPLKVSLLRDNEHKKPNYAVCHAKVGFERADIDCLELAGAQEEKVALALSKMKLDLASTAGMDRLLALYAPPFSLAVYQQPVTTKVGETKDVEYSTRLYFVVATGDQTTTYATPEGQRWRYARSWFGPADPLGAMPIKVPLIHADDLDRPRICTARIDIGGVTVENCTQYAPAQDSPRQ